MDRQIFELDDKSTILSDFIPVQDEFGSSEAGKISLEDLKTSFIPYRSYRAIVSLSGGPTLTVEEIQNDFDGVTFAFTNPSNGLITVTASEVVFNADKTASPAGSIYNAGTAYFFSGVYFSTTVFNFRITLHDNTASGTPNFTGVLFEIIVGN